MAGCATTREAPSPLPGVYDLMAINEGSRSSSGAPSFRWITLSPEGIWEAVWQMSPRTNTRGVFSVEGERDGCTQLLLRSTDGRLWTSPQDKAPEELQFPAELCDGELTILDYPTPVGPVGWNSVAGLGAYYPTHPGHKYILNKRREPKR